MERLTEKHYLGTDHYMKCSGNCNVDMDCIDCPSFDRLVERLAAYEDTGLEPEQCENAKAIIESAFSDDTSKAERIRELLKADRDGRLVVLPCKVGGTVWAILDGAKYARECKVDFVNIGNVGTTFVLSAKNGLREQYGVTVTAFGKTVFLTREEAEKALEAMKK